MAYNGADCSAPVPALGKQFPEMLEPPELDILGINVGAPNPNVVPWSQGGNFAMISTNFVNTFQWSDQLSWNHGKHALRAGFEAQHIQYNNTIPASGRGELLMYSTADFLTSSSGPAADGTPATAAGGITLGFGLKGALTHYNRINEVGSYIQDDIKVNRKLTVNVGVRWEYSGFPDPTLVESSPMCGTPRSRKLNTGSALAALGATGTLTGFVVPTELRGEDVRAYGPSGATGVAYSGTNTLLPGSPLNEFAPRIGLAWQPLGDRFVVRAGYGWFWDTIYGNLLIDNQLNLPPYSGAGSGPSPLNQENTLHNPVEGRREHSTRVDAPLHGPAVPSIPILGRSAQPAFALPVSGTRPIRRRWAAGCRSCRSTTSTCSTSSCTAGSPTSATWAAMAFISTTGLETCQRRPFGGRRTERTRRLRPGAPQNTEMIAASLPYNDPANPNPITTNTIGQFTSNLNERVSYLGFAPGGVARRILSGTRSTTACRPNSDISSDMACS